MSRSHSRTIYVGNLPGDIRKSEVEDIFYKYGKIVDVDLKLPPRPPAYAFVEFESSADADDAVRGRDGYEFGGEKLRVEVAHSGAPRDRGGARGDFRERFGPSRRSEFRVLVTGLPPSASWQDLKDHMRKAGTVTFAQVFRDGTGICDYESMDDMRYAIRKLDDTEFKNPFASAYIRVKEERDGARRSRSRSPLPRRRNRSKSKSKSRSKSRSKSSSRSKSRSRSRSSVSRSPAKARSASPLSD